MKKIISIILFLIVASIGGAFYYYDIFAFQDNIKQPTIVNINKEIICETNKDCVPENSLIGILYICEEKKCIERSLNSPASSNCQEKKGTVDIRVDAKNVEYRVCVFSDNSECEEWKFFHNECKPGDFNLNDNIWKGKIVKSRKIEHSYYFEMLNGEYVKAVSDDNQITDLLFSLQSKEEIVKLKGEMSGKADNIGYRKLNVKQILNLNDIIFNQVDEESSLEIAKKAIQENNEFIKNEGDELELINTQTLKCPYCWIFNFSYLSKGQEKKKIEITMQEGEIKKISFVKESEILYDCEEFSMVTICTEQYEPVCAKLKKNIPNMDDGGLSSGSDYEIKWKTFSNACKACVYKGKIGKVVGYKNGECEST
ncbi:MAG: DUF333 domain-containing protein [Patescibacteria group bacterium]|nr:DUF333 domain-containing protein [Patescibacteria group bacterium]